MSIASYITIQKSIGNVISLLNKRQLNVPYSLKNAVNYLFEDEDGRVVGIDIRSKVPITMLTVMANKISTKDQKIDRFIMVTPYAPSKEESAEFNKVFKNKFSQVEWLTPKTIGKQLGLKGDVNLDSPAVSEKLRLASVKGDLEKDEKKKAQSKTKPVSETAKVNEIVKSAPEEEETDDMQQYVKLTKNIPMDILRKMRDAKQKPDEFFNIGGSTKDVIIVVSDIINFSLLVRSAYAEDLNEAMYKYYREAQHLIHQYGGILDKFIGDSVVAVFNYPTSAPENYVNAIKFAAHLVLLGKQVMYSLQENIDERIVTGTRIGIATGEIWTLNIGIDEIDITFVGDKINLASRLEHECSQDSILISNIMQRKISETDHKFHAQLAMKERVVPTERVKGQPSDITSWEIPTKSILKLVR